MAKTVVINKKKFPLNSEFKIFNIDGIWRLFSFESDYDSCKIIINNGLNIYLPLYIDDSEEVKTLTTEYNNTNKVGIAYISNTFSKAYLGINKLNIIDKLKIENLIKEDVKILNSLLKHKE